MVAPNVEVVMAASAGASAAAIARGRRVAVNVELPMEAHAGRPAVLISRAATRPSWFELSAGSLSLTTM